MLLEVEAGVVVVDVGFAVAGFWSVGFLAVVLDVGFVVGGLRVVGLVVEYVVCFGIGGLRIARFAGGGFWTLGFSVLAIMDFGM